MSWKDIIHGREHKYDIKDISLLHVLGHLIGNIYESQGTRVRAGTIATSTLELGIYLAREYPELTDELLEGLSQENKDKAIAAARNVHERMPEIREVRAEFLRDVEDGKI